LKPAVGPQFYKDTLGLELLEEERGHHAKFEGQSAFICLEQKGAESYPSKDKAAIFLEVADIQSTIDAIGKDQLVKLGTKNKDGHISWAVLHDPKGHNVLILQTRRNSTSPSEGNLPGGSQSPQARKPNLRQQGRADSRNPGIRFPQNVSFRRIVFFRLGSLAEQNVPQAHNKN